MIFTGNTVATIFRLKRSIFVLLCIAFSTSQITITAAENPIIIGVATSLTSLEGKESLLAVRMAVAEINGRGGVKMASGNRRIHLKTVDLKDSSPDLPVQSALQRLEEFLETASIHALVVGPFRSEVLLPAMDLVARFRVPMIETIAMTPAMEAKVMKNPKYKYVFRTGLNTTYLTDYLIESMRFLNTTYGFDRVYIMSQDVAWARSTTSLMIKLYFDRKGWQISGTRHYPSDTVDYSAGLTEAAALGAQVILPIFDAPNSGNLVTQWKMMNLPSLLCGFISPMVGPGAWERFGSDLDGVLNVVFELGNMPSVKYTPAADFHRAYTTRFGEQIQAGHGPAPAYEAVFILAEAIESADSLDADRLVAALERTDRYGVMGRLRFHQGHQVIFGDDPATEAVACLVQWTKDGRRTIVYPPTIAEDDIHLPQAIRP
ncbi:MAG: ABC transporter substrate-binding protein [Desulfobacteraceae bacterium]|nr:ABC transporter substrate-binding protein [Desulfobacteraceae bacterium]